MKRILILLFFTLLTSFSVFSQGMEFFKGTWEEALQEAKKQDKIIFIDGYTVWCGPCKRMKKHTFTDDEVGKFFNKHFINMALDMEKTEGMLFRKKYPVDGFPTLYFIDYDGTVIHKEKGARQPDAFLKLGEFVLTKIDRTQNFEEDYNAGNRDPEFIYNYVKALNKAGKPSQKIVNDYLKTQKDLTTEQNLKFIFAAVSEADSKAFDLMIKYRNEIGKLEGEDNVKEKIEGACDKTVIKAIEFSVEDLLNEAKKNMKKYYPEKSGIFSMTADMKYYKNVKNAKKYLKACKKYVKKEVKQNAKKLNNLAHEMAKNFEKDKKNMAFAEKIAKTAAENGGLYGYYYTYAEILFINGKREEAITAANKSLEIAKEENRRAIGLVRQLINKIES